MEFIVGWILGVTVACFIAASSTTLNGSIMKEKEFVIKNASYKCFKTNELLKEKK